MDNKTTKTRQTKNIDDEVQFHIDEAVDTLIGQGWTREAARAEAERRFGNSARYRRRLTVMTRAAAIREALRFDWRNAVRSLRAAPVVTIAAILSLGLGVGANTALFSIVNGLLLKPLPVHEPDRLATLAGDDWTNPIWERIRDQHAPLFAGAAAWANESFDLAPAGASEVVDGIFVSGSFFDVLGIQPGLGRLLTTGDDVRGGGSDGPVVVISQALRHRRFGGTPAIVGRTLSVNRLPFTIVGVLPPSFFGPEVGRAPDVYLPLASEALIRGNESRLDQRSSWWLSLLVRRHPGQTLDDAAAALNGARADIRAVTMPSRPEAQQQYLTENFTLADASTGKSALRSRFASPLIIVTIIVAGVLLIACANLANLMLARATARRQEISVRLALGASRARLGRQMLAEALLLSMTGSVIGLLIAQWGGALLVRQLGSSVSSVTLNLSTDWRVLGLTAAIAIVTTIFFGLAPLSALTGIEPNQALGQSGRAVVGDRRVSVRNALVIVQVALSVVLVVAASLFVRTFHGLATAPLGFSADELVIVNVDAGRSTVSQDGMPEFYQRVTDAAASAPGVRMAASSVLTPLSGQGWNDPVGMPDGSPPPRDRMTFVNAVGPGWFAAYGMRILAGRDLNRLDTKGAPPVVVVNEMFVRRFLSDTPPIGARVTIGSAPRAETFEVVGVVNDAVYRSARRGVVPTIYHPLEQAGGLGRSFSVTLNVPGDRRALTAGLHEALRHADPGLAFSVRSYSDRIGAAIAQERIVAMLSGFFGLLALMLAGIGLYGVTSYAVSRRTREVAMRMALGADAGNVVRLILRNVAVIVVIGATIGVALSMWASQFVKALLFEVEARDPLTLVATVVTLTTVALFAAWMPARRAAKLDPNIVLRQ